VSSTEVAYLLGLLDFRGVKSGYFGYFELSDNLAKA
jgi:hypothetical protein